MKNKRKKWKIVLIVIPAVLVLSLAGFLIYAGIYYHADESAQRAMQSDTSVTVEQKDGLIVFSPKRAEWGLIFYPGGKVEAEAYAPLMHRLAEKNVQCVIVKMPFRLAVLHQNGADGVRQKFPSVRHWYIGGHSLGGVMAASYAAGHSDDFEGLLLLAAYSTKDLRSSGLKVLSVYGSEDGVLNRDKYNEGLSRLPKDSRELVIKGGNHAQFGSYGEQKGDGKATISADEQLRQTVEFILHSIDAELTPQPMTSPVLLCCQRAA